ncbi:kinase-like domain-containing protein [Tribonema minus]|uniref:non-specific serine/threonine protein kinase n=1 Tax=Tribonema minus TaxID=303371 RepID=A0A835YLD2_9STRA|nr:kinase-like domain-containing protein [Tribonema minus]
MRVLGRGAFGAVTLVKDIRDSRLYAIKTLPWGDREDLRTAALAEVSLMRQLRHPFLVTLVDAFISVDGRLVCLAMTYCESGDLAKVIEHARKRSAPLAEKQVVSWFCQACLGIAHLHARHQLLHRDIKPANLLLTESSRLLRIGDFGLAKTLGSHGQTVKTEVGTPYYTSPEMCSGAAYGYPSDVWSLGVVLHEMLALDVPFRGRDTVELVSRVACAAPPALPARYGTEVRDERRALCCTAAVCAGSAR